MGRSAFSKNSRILRSFAGIYSQSRNEACDVFPELGKFLLATDVKRVANRLISLFYMAQPMRRPFWQGRSTATEE